MRFALAILLLGLSVAFSRGWWQWRNHHPAPVSAPQIDADPSWIQNAWGIPFPSGVRLRSLSDLLAVQWPHAKIQGLHSLPNGSNPEELRRMQDLRRLLQSWSHLAQESELLKSLSFSSQQGELHCQLEAQGPAPAILALCADLLAAKATGGPIPDPRFLRIRPTDGNLKLSLTLTPFARRNL